MKIQTISITPRVAEEMLKKNTANRPLCMRSVAQLAQAMERGEWKSNGDTIRVSTDDVLLDGQHRLKAIAVSGVTQTYIVVSELPPETFKTIDQGKLRSAGQILALDGVKNYNAVAHAARLMHRFKVCGNPHNGTPENQPTATQISDFVKENPELLESISYVTGKKWLIKYLGIGRAGFLIEVFSEHDEEAADKFFDELDSGMFSYANSPVLLLRDRLMEDKNSKTRMAPTYLTALAFKSFNSFCASKPVKALRIRTEGDAPEKNLFSLTTGGK